MKTILVTTDLSGNSKAGIRLAVQLAKQMKAKLIFYYVSEITKPTSWSERHYRQFEKEKTEEKNRLLRRFIHSVGGESKITGEATFIVELGLDVDRMIIHAAGKYKADLICMSTRGAGKVRKLFGTNASKIITASPVPVLVVPQRYRERKIDTLFFACDFGNLQREMKPVLDLALQLKARIDVFHYDYLLNVPENAKKLEQKARRYESDVIAFHFRKFEIDYSLTDHLAKDIKKEKPAIVILFTKQNRNWFDRLLVPSEAAEMSFHSNVPLLTFRKKMK